MTINIINLTSRFHFKQSIIFLAAAILLWTIPKGGVCSDIMADASGEIINISHHYKIAFADVGTENFKPGDIVQVHILKNGFIYLRVLEASVALSKLGFVDTRQYTTDPAKFKQITVGSSVKKVAVEDIAEEFPISSPQERSAPNEKDLLKGERQSGKDEINQLKKELRDERNRNSALMKKFDGASSDQRGMDHEMERHLKKIDELNSIIVELRDKLKNMEKITQKAIMLSK